jgi:hypothetical protein
MLSGLAALTVAAMFTGAAVYINVAEQPARLHLDDGALLTQWKPSYKRGFALQATLAVIGFLFGALTWWSSGKVIWLVGACLLVANWPFTLLVIMPVNNRLMSTRSEDAGPGTRQLIHTWARLHGVRSMLGAAATATFLLAFEAAR